MLRTGRIFTFHRPWSSRAPCCARAGRGRWLVAALVAGLLSLLPLVARPLPPEPVTEALFLCDPLPPGGRDLSVSLAAPGDGDGRTLLPRVQLALALGERLGVTADVGLGPAAAPGASLKLLLRAPSPGAPGLAVSFDLAGARLPLGETETALGLGLVQQAGGVTLRAGASVATPVGALAPHLHAGVSAALAPAARWRLLGELIGELRDGSASWSAGPTAKVSLGARSALAAGALVDLRSPSRTPSFVVQLTQAL